jgi:hypothetical protein
MEIGNWVPQVFYDLIGRVIPGMFLLLLGAILLDPESLKELCRFAFHDTPIPLLILVPLGLVVSYVTGTLLGAFGFAVWEVQWRKKKVGSLRLDVPEPTNDDPNSGISFKYDAVLLLEPSAGARMVKLRAERHFSRVIVVGTVILIGLYLAKNSAPSDAKAFGVLVGLGTMAWAAYLFDVHLAIRTTTLLMNYWYLLGRPLRLPKERAIAGEPARPRAQSGKE